jgi:hypothetical protein
MRSDGCDRCMSCGRCDDDACDTIDAGGPIDAIDADDAIDACGPIDAIDAFYAIDAGNAIDVSSIAV